MKPVAAGTETVHGMPTEVSEFVMEGSTAKSKVWIDSKYGLILQILMAQPSGPPKMALDTTLTVGPPAANAFALPARPARPCRRRTTASSAITGGPASDYAFANKGTASDGGCLILFHVFRAGSMTPVTSGFEVFMDGKPVPLQNGLARLLNAPKEFNLDVRVPNGGATGPIVRQCSAPQTTLLLLAKNWENIGEGADWVWVKSGKFARH